MTNELHIRIKKSNSKILNVDLETRGFVGEACLIATGAIVARNESAIVGMTEEFYEDEIEAGLETG